MHIFLFFLFIALYNTLSPFLCQERYKINLSLEKKKKNNKIKV